MMQNHLMKNKKIILISEYVHTAKFIENLSNRYHINYFMYHIVLRKNIMVVPE